VTRPRRTRAGLLTVGLAAVLLVGCGGSGGTNGVEKLSANDALDKVRHATESVRSVHVTGQINQSGQTLGLDIRVGTGAASGTVNLAGGTMDLRLVHGVTYFRGDQKVFAAFGANPAEAALAAERWIKDTSSSGPAAGFSAFLDSHQLFQSLLTPQGKLNTGGTTTIAGHKAFVLVDESTDGGKLYVADTGAALPLRIERTGSNGGRVDFSDYNADINVDVPPDAVDISKLSGG
jgi:hypothetical protein